MINEIKIYLLCVIISISCFYQCLGYLESDSWVNLELQHAIDPRNLDKFVFRGNVTIPSLHVGLANVIQEPLGPDERQNLMKLAERNNFYRLKANVIYADGSQSSFLTSTKACALTNSQLNDVLWISIDSAGSLTGVTQTVTNNADCSSNSAIEDLENFNTDVLIKHMELAPIPDTNTFIQKLDREREARERGQVTDNRGFFAKYWMYIVPIALLVLISGATNPETQSGGGR